MFSDFLVNVKTLMPKEDLILHGSYALYLGLVGVRFEYRQDYKISWLTSMFVSSRRRQIRRNEIDCSSTCQNPCICTFHHHRPVSFGRNIIHSGRSRWPRSLRLGLRPLACWDYGFDCRRRHGHVFSDYYVLLGRGLFVGVITQPHKS
jgi:hypothetical protein